MRCGSVHALLRYLLQYHCTDGVCVRVHECMLDSELTAVYLEIIKHMFCVVSSVAACSFISCSAVQMA